MKLRDLIASKDGSLSLTKLSAATAHFLMACCFLRLQVLGVNPFDKELWLLYGAFAIGHAAYDKTTRIVQSVRERRLDSLQPLPSEPPTQ